MLMSVEERYAVPTQRLLALTLSIPLDPSQYDYIPQFFQAMLNAEDAKSIAVLSNVKFDKDKSYEILPDIILPNDLWFKDTVSIKDCKMKVTMLTEMNQMIMSELQKDGEPLDETILVYYQKLLQAYRFYELPVRYSYQQDTSQFSVKEEIDEETDDYTVDDKLLNRTISNQSSTTSLKTHFSFFSHSSSNNNNVNFNALNNPKRSLTSLRENLSILTRRRLLSIIPGNNHKDVDGRIELSLPSPVEAPEEDNKKQQTLNSILSKSRIYSKIKKNRELLSSMNSNLSFPSYSRNSVSTTSTVSSSKSKRSSNIVSPDTSDLKHPSYALVPAFATYSLTQKQDLQKLKSEYYEQILVLLHHINHILGQFRLNHKDAKAFKLMDFIKRYIFRFVVLDVCDMVISYGENEAYRLYSRLS